MKTYKVKIYRIILGIFYSIMAGLAAGAISLIFFDQDYTWPTVITAGVFLLSLWLGVIDTMLTIEINDTTMTVKKGHKTKTYELAKTNFRGRTTTSQGETSCQLYAEVDGQEDLIDCELIGIKQFEQILADVGLTGDKAPVTKLNAKK